MQYRKFGKTAENLSILGFGAMRLPTIGDDNSQIDYDKAIKMVRYSIDNGVNYLDTAYPYHGGKSEAFCAAAMKDGYREKVNIATKCPTWAIEKHEDFYSKLEEQMGNLEVDQIDFYLIHALGHDLWAKATKSNYKAFLDDAKKQGKIRYAGFSFHDDLDLFKEIVDDYDWDFCQIQLNYMDEEFQAGIEGMEYAHKKGLGVIIMEPLRGGLLAREELPEEVKNLFNSYDSKRTPAEWALKYLWDKKEVGLLLSGMSTLEQVKQNINTASDATVGCLSAQEHEIINKVRDFYISRTAINCTDCKYCMPCPAGVNIPGNFRAYNHEAMYDDHQRAHELIHMWMDEGERASNCVQCGQCEEKCPQNIEIMKNLAIIAEKY
ncbi:MAG: aldo/keto reductase [Eubacteriales bacterium]